MSERSGFWSPLSNPWIYEGFHHLIGARRWLRRFARETIRPSAGDCVLDIGCGPGALLQYLPHAAYIGFDRSASYVERARSASGGRGTFICDDVGNFGTHHLPPVDVAVAIGVLHHLDDETALDLFRKVAVTLKSDGRMITVDPCFHPNQSFLQRFVVSNDRGMYVRPYERYGELCGAVFSDIRSQFQRGHFPFPHSVCIMQATATPQGGRAPE